MPIHKTRLWKTGTIKAVTFAVLGFTGLAGAGQIAGGLSRFFGIPLEMVLEALPSLLLAARHMLQPCAFGHIGLLERLLQLSSSWPLVLTLTGA